MCIRDSHRPAEAVEKIGDGFGVDVSDTIPIPEDLRAMRGPVRRECAGAAQAGEQAQRRRERGAGERQAKPVEDARVCRHWHISLQFR